MITTTTFTVALLSTFALTASVLPTRDSPITDLFSLGGNDINPQAPSALRNPPAGNFLLKRDCTYNGCRCSSRGKQLTVCGNCKWLNNNTWVVTEKRVANHIFECSPTGKCCDYGYATDCGRKDE